jgi:type I restriction enzyme R subunit
MITDINSEDRLVQKTFADHLETVLGWESIYAHNEETFGPTGTLGAPANARSSSFAIFAPR